MSFVKEFDHSPLLNHPSRILVAGPTNSGKTHLVRRLLEEPCFTDMPKKILYCYTAWQKTYDELQKQKLPITFHQGFPATMIEDRDYWPADGGPYMIVLDDLQHDQNDVLLRLQQIYSHHYNISVILVWQSLFGHCKLQAQISRQCNHLFLMSSKRDFRALSVLGSQLLPKNNGAFVRLFQEATVEPYSFLHCDLDSRTPSELRFRGSLPSEERQVVYLQ